MRLIYKILDREAWNAALACGVFEGSPIDRADGYIHFSTADQAQETARRHFHGQSDLVLLSVEAEALGSALRWEPSRGGALFPHLYGPLPIDRVTASVALTTNADGAPDLSGLTS